MLNLIQHLTKKHPYASGDSEIKPSASWQTVIALQLKNSE